WSPRCQWARLLCWKIFIMILTNTRSAQTQRRLLDELVKTLREYPTMKIELSSHTDSRGNDAYNLALSQRRAQSAVDYLVSQGIDRSRMVVKGYGETRLVNECANGVDCTEEQHQANRRTEVTVLDL